MRSKSCAGDTWEELNFLILRTALTKSKTRCLRNLTESKKPLESRVQNAPRSVEQIVPVVMLDCIVNVVELSRPILRMPPIAAYKLATANDLKAAILWLFEGPDGLYSVKS